MGDDDPKVLNFRGIGPANKEPDLHVTCPRCRKSNFMRDQKCQHCGVWFLGEAFQFAPSEPASSRRRRALVAIAWFLLAVAVIGIVAIAMA